MGPYGCNHSAASPAPFFLLGLYPMSRHSWSWYHVVTASMHDLGKKAPLRRLAHRPHRSHYATLRSMSATPGRRTAPSSRCATHLAIIS